MESSLAGSVPERKYMTNQGFKLLHVRDSTVAAQYLNSKTTGRTLLVRLN
jgi:hypothetical protein